LRGWSFLLGGGFAAVFRASQTAVFGRSGCVMVVRGARAFFVDRRDPFGGVPQITKSYSDFVRTFETAKRELAARGARIEKMVFDVAAITEMVEWCHRHGYEIDTRGRAAFGAVRAMGGLSAPLVDKTRSVQ
jgi:hypothetical protein